MKQNPLEEAQKIRLDEKEFNFCKNLAGKISRYNSSSETDRREALLYVKKECEKKKYSCELNVIPTEDDYLVYEFKLNTKPCYIAFKKDGKEPVNLIPSGVINLENMPTTK